MPITEVDMSISACKGCPYVGRDGNAKESCICIARNLPCKGWEWLRGFAVSVMKDAGLTLIYPQGELGA